MGKLISFWSPESGKGRVTSCAAAIGCYLSVIFGADVSLTEVPGGRRKTEELFDAHITVNLRNNVYRKSGLNALRLMFRQERTDAEKIKECAMKTVIDGFDVFPNVMHPGEVTDSGDMCALSSIITGDMKNAYDYVLIDLGAGTDSITEGFMDKSDLVVVMLPQNMRSWKNYFHEFGDKMNGKNVMFVVNGFVKGASNSLKRFDFIFRKRLSGKKVIGIPFNVCFMDAVACGEVAYFFSCNARKDRDDVNGEFFRSIMAIVREIRCVA